VISWSELAVLGIVVLKVRTLCVALIFINQACKIGQLPSIYGDSSERYNYFTSSLKKCHRIY